MKGKSIGGSFGEALKLSGDGTILAISASNNDDKAEDAGQVVLYRWNESSSNYEQLEVINGAAAGDRFGGEVGKGVSLALSSDGTTLAIGSKYHNNNSGYVKIYSIDNGIVSFRQELFGENVNDYFGRAITISNDGNVLAITALGARLINVYRREDASSDYELIDEPIRTEEDRYVHSLTLSAQGNVSTLPIHKLSFQNRTPEGVVSLSFQCEDIGGW